MSNLTLTCFWYTRGRYLLSPPAKTPFNYGCVTQLAEMRPTLKLSNSAFTADALKRVVRIKYWKPPKQGTKHISSEGKRPYNLKNPPSWGRTQTRATIEVAPFDKKKF